MSRALSRPVSIVQRARAGALATLLADIAEADLGMAMAAARASELPTAEAGEALLALGKDELQRQGWASRHELQVAIDARRNSKEVPFYLRMAHERVLMRYRGHEGERPGSKALIVMPNDAAEPPPDAVALPAQEAEGEAAR